MHVPDVNLELVSSQNGTAILNLTTGEIIKSTGLLRQENPTTFATLHSIVKESIRSLGNEGLKKLTINLHDFSYTLTAADGYIYIIRNNVQ